MKGYSVACVDVPGSLEKYVGKTIIPGEKLDGLFITYNPEFCFYETLEEASLHGTNNCCVRIEVDYDDVIEYWNRNCDWDITPGAVGLCSKLTILRIIPNDSLEFLEAAAKRNHYQVARTYVRNKANFELFRKHIHSSDYAEFWANQYNDPEAVIGIITKPENAFKVAIQHPSYKDDFKHIVTDEIYSYKWAVHFPEDRDYMLQFVKSQSAAFNWVYNWPEYKEKLIVYIGDVDIDDIEPSQFK